MSKRSASCQFCFRYIFLYLFSKDSPFNFNPRGVQLLEELVIAVLPGICSESDNNFKTICFILFSFYEIFFRDLEKSVHVLSSRTRNKSSACKLNLDQRVLPKMHSSLKASFKFMSNRQNLFSSYFLRFLRSITLWHTSSLWNYAVAFLFNYVDCRSINLYFSNYPKTLKKNKKSHLKYPREIYSLLFQTTNYLLKMDIKMTLQVFTKINLKNSHMNLGDFEEMSRKLENVHFSENIGKTIVKNPKTHINKIILVLKKSLPFCSISQEYSIFKLTYLNSECSKRIRPPIIKRILMKDRLDKKHRKALWKLLSEVSALCKSPSNFSQQRRNE
mgnify:CR=1 FL=1